MALDDDEIFRINEIIESGGEIRGMGLIFSHINLGYEITNILSLEKEDSLSKIFGKSTDRSKNYKSQKKERYEV